MNAFPILLAAVLAAAGVAPAAARDPDGPGSATRTTTAAAGEEPGCAMMKEGRTGTRGKRPPMGGHPPMHGPVLEPALPPRQAAALGLDADQRQRLAAIEKQGRVHQWALLGELREERLALAEQLGAAEPDPATATARLRAVQAVEAKLLEARLAARRDAMAVLTPQQRSQLLSAPHPHGEAGGGRAAAASRDGQDQDDEDEDDDPKAPGGAPKDPHAGHH